MTSNDSGCIISDKKRGEYALKDRIKKIRKELDLTQQKFADRIGIKQNTVAQYEIGRNIPIDSVISLICREFNVNENWLRTGEGDMFIELSRDEEIANFVGDILKDENESFKKRFISMLINLDESDWETLAKAVDLLQKRTD